MEPAASALHDGSEREDVRRRRKKPRPPTGSDGSAEGAVVLGKVVELDAKDGRSS